MHGLARFGIWVLIFLSLMLCAGPGWGAPLPGLEDTFFGTNGKAATTDPPDSTKAAGRICPASKSGDVDTDYALAVDLFGSLLQGNFGAFVGSWYGSQQIVKIDSNNPSSFFGCTGAASGSSQGYAKAPSAATNDIYAVGSIGGEAAIINYQPASGTFTDIPIDLSNSGSDRLLGIAHLSGSTFAVAGQVNAQAIVRSVDLSSDPPSVSGGIIIDLGAPDSVFFDVALSRDGTAGFVVGRTATYLIVCKLAFPGGTLVSEFAGGGCELANFGGQFAEGHQVVVLNNGDIAIVGTVYYSGTPRMFIAVVNAMTGAQDNAFDSDALWVENISGSTQSEGWGLVAMDFGFAAVGWADISGQRELIMPVFDGLQPDTRYPNSGIVHEAIGTGGHAISVALAAPASPTALRDFDFAVAGDENDGAQAFVIQYQAVQPDSLFGNGFD